MNGTIAADLSKTQRVQAFFRSNPVRESWPWRHWNAHPLVARAINKRISGAPDKTLPQTLVEVLPGLGLNLPAERTASLGCGRGGVDRGLYRHGLVKSLVGFDITRESVEVADQLARSSGIAEFKYCQADLNNLQLEPESYDLVICQMSLHHVFNLEHLYDEIARALRPGGLLLADEFVGPTRFQWTERQMQVVNGLLTVLPSRFLLTPEGQVKPLVIRQPESFFEQIDPSEAIRSGEVLPCLEQNFIVRWKRPYGGAILHPMLYEIAWNFREGDLLSETLLTSAIAIEDAMMTAGDLESDFAVLVASPR